MLNLNILLKNFLLNKLIHLENIGVFILDKSYKIILWNFGGEKITGYIKEEILGKNFEEISIMEIFENKREIDLHYFVNNLFLNKENSEYTIFFKA